VAPGRRRAPARRGRGPSPLLLGRHLIARGIAPGPQFGPILKEAFEAQLEGGFADEAGALEWLDKKLGAKA
jgi:tRNA nucleotidyltransferase (CCA-adding enzyme)